MLPKANQLQTKATSPHACSFAQVVGATGSSIVSYLLPGLCYFRLRQGHHPLRYAALGVFALGMCIMALSIASMIGKAVAPSRR